MSVTQADHEAADQWKREWEHCWGSHTALVAAFADHRLAERARIVAWLLLDETRAAHEATGDEAAREHPLWWAADAVERGEHDR